MQRYDLEHAQRQIMKLLAEKDRFIKQLLDELSECEMCKQPMVDGRTVKPFVCVACWNRVLIEKDKCITTMAELLGRWQQHHHQTGCKCSYCEDTRKLLGGVNHVLGLDDNVLGLLGSRDGLLHPDDPLGSLEG